MSFTEEEIRPKKFDEGKQKAIEEDLKWFLDQKDSFVQVDCPACKTSHENSPTFKKYDFEFHRCGECRTVYISPRPTEAILAEFYSISKNYAFWAKHIFPATEQSRRELLFHPRAKRTIELAKKFGASLDTLIDIGGANGIFADELSKLNAFKKVIVVEPHSELAEQCRKLNLNVIESTIEKVSLEEHAPTVLVCFEVIATLFDPLAFLTLCAQKIPSGALFILTCPNVEGFDILELGPLSDNIDFENLNMFHPDSLQHLFSKAGFKVLECQTPGELDTDMIKRKVDEGILELSEKPFLKKLLVDNYEQLKDPFQEFLKENQLSSHMWIVCQKS